MDLNTYVQEVYLNEKSVNRKLGISYKAELKARCTMAFMIYYYGKLVHL